MCFVFFSIFVFSMLEKAHANEQIEQKGKKTKQQNKTQKRKQIKK